MSLSNATVNTREVAFWKALRRSSFTIMPVKAASRWSMAVSAPG